MTQDVAREWELADVHVHLQDKRFGESLDDVAAVAARAAPKGVRRFVCAATSPADWNRLAKIAKNLPDVYPCFGVHPWFCESIQGDWIAPLKMFLDEFVARDGLARPALGEVGLDFVVRNCDDAARKRQEDVLSAQLDLADERALPVVLHSVRANDRVLDAMKERRNVPTWLLHGWNATAQEIERAVELGAFFSFSRRNVSPNARRGRETILAVPRDRILLESDGPNPLPPDGYDNPDPNWQTKGVRMRDASGALVDGPESVATTATRIAALRGTAIDEFLAQTSLNERRFFSNWPMKKN